MGSFLGIKIVVSIFIRIALYFTTKKLNMLQFTKLTLNLLRIINRTVRTVVKPRKNLHIIAGGSHYTIKRIIEQYILLKDLKQYY